MAGPLDGLKILDLTMNLPGPYMTWLLATMGAEVVKIENPQGGDYARALLGGREGKSSPFFEAVNRNKKSVTVNLKDPRGRGLLLALLERFEVLVEGFRPGTLDRFELGYDVLSERFPRLIQVSISGYGQEGPYRSRAGHDLNYLSLGGIIGMTGTRDGRPGIPGVQIADLAGGSLMALTGLLAAVIERERTGRGRLVDISMFHGALSLATMVLAGVEAGLESPEPGAMVLNGRCPCYGLYETSDGRYMSLGAIEFKFWKGFCEAVDRPDLLGAQYAGPEITDEVARIFRERTQQDWIEVMKERDACCEPVVSLTEAVESDLVAVREMIRTGPDGRRYLGSPLASPDFLGPEETPAPTLGRDTREVLSGLGLAEKDLDSLAADGVI